MKARTALLITAAAALFVGALETPSHAAQALWEKQQKWTIIGDASRQWCLAEGNYPDGVTFRIARSNSGWNFSIDGVRAEVGQKYDVAMATSRNSGVLTGVGTTPTQVTFPGINTETMVELATARSIYIQGLGKYNLPGSYKAMQATYDCWKAMTGSDA